mmetsp:Transcript_38351/g.62476  ORF Transcript_38351/g.62476 Transcript_38351/m.62476 type:complete len:201 (+) Transcript_38351:632-1234(+)
MVPEKVNPLKGSPPLQNTENKKLLGNLHKHEALMDAWAEPSGCKDSITTTLEHHRLEEEDKTMSNSKTGKKTPGSGTGNPAATGRRRPLKCNRYLNGNRQRSESKRRLSLASNSTVRPRSTPQRAQSGPAWSSNWARKRPQTRLGRSPKSLSDCAGAPAAPNVLWLPIPKAGDAQAWTPGRLGGQAGTPCRLERNYRGSS